jgi:hypothetical protein
VKERPILFKGEMVNAILAGHKTQTRRIVKPTCSVQTFYDYLPNDEYPYYMRRKDAVWDSFKTMEKLAKKYCPYGTVGDRLWVRETWGQYILDIGDVRQERRYVYRADEMDTPSDNGCDTPWRPSIFMPRHASRITLEIADVRVQRLQDITEADILAEGVTVDLAAKMTGTPWSDLPTLHHAWAALWDYINYEKAPYESNPYVWALTFKRIDAAAIPPPVHELAGESNRGSK